MERKELIKKYIEFFKSKGHKEIKNSSLIPENDPTVLFTTAGMQPIVPYLLGEEHPLGKRLCNIQRCIRTVDIEEVGDSYHHTFFEMFGNWSLGDYWKKQAIELTFEFYSKILKIPLNKIAVTCFAGNKNAPEDKEAIKIWENLGIPRKRIALLKDNWWGPAGKTGPCGPNTEIFYWKPKSPAPETFDPSDEKNWVELGNDVLMEFVKDKRVILVDGMHTIYDKVFNLNKELLDSINNLNTHTILTVAGFREKGKNIVKSYNKNYDLNWEAFSLEEKGIKKDNPEYFKILLKKFGLVPEEVIYFDHDKQSVETAKKLGILSEQYIDNKLIIKFVEDNLYCYKLAKQKNIDFGGGIERNLAALNELDDNYLTDCFKPLIEEIEKLSGKRYGKNEEETKAMRIIADHIKAAVFIIADGIVPSNTEQGYVLRRLIRRAIFYGKKLGIPKEEDITTPLTKKIIKIYSDYSHLKKKQDFIIDELNKEEDKFEKTLEKGMSKFEQLSKDKNISAEESFLLYQSYGFPIEMTQELAKEKGIKVDEKGFQKELAKHQELSRTTSAGKFKSGLADNSEQTTKLHTATHLLLSALRTVLKDETIMQKGSNITPERLRVDFNFPRKLTEDEIKKVEDLVNSEIKKSCEVKREELSPEKAKKEGAIGVFDNKYGEKVSVYTIGDFSKEICTGPHVKNTCEIGYFKILKEESSSAGVRRIKAIIE